MKNRILILFLLFLSSTSFSQQEITWVDLAQVEMEEKFISEYDAYFPVPKFSSFILSLEGKEVTITGYYLDIDPRGRLFVLSKGPMASCYFCGVGGPETAIELYFKSNQSFKTDEVITVTGTLKLNRSNLDQFYYILDDSEANTYSYKLKK